MAQSAGDRLESAAGGRFERHSPTVSSIAAAAAPRYLSERTFHTQQERMGRATYTAHARGIRGGPTEPVGLRHIWDGDINRRRRVDQRQRRTYDVFVAGRPNPVAVAAAQCDQRRFN